MNILTYLITLLWLHFEARMALVDEYLCRQRCDFNEARYWRGKHRDCLQEIEDLRFDRWIKSVPL